MGTGWSWLPLQHKQDGLGRENELQVGWKCCRTWQLQQLEHPPPRVAQEELRVGNNPSTALSFHPLTPPASSSEAPGTGDRLDVSLLVTQVCPSWSHKCVPPGHTGSVPPGMFVPEVHHLCHKTLPRFPLFRFLQPPSCLEI